MFRHAMITEIKKYGMIKKDMPFVIGRIKSLETRIETRDDEEFAARSGELAKWRKIRRDSDEFIRDMDWCLSQLTPREEKAIRSFFIDRQRFYCEDLEIAWNVERTTVYNIKNRALDKLIFYWFGYQKDENYRKLKKDAPKKKTSETPQEN